MKITANDIINLAEKQVGIKEYPMNSNKVKYNTAYYGREVSGSAYPWCCAFVWWIFNELKANDLFYGGKKTAYCPTLRNYHKKQRITDNYKPGDIIFFDFTGKKKKAGHVGICVEFNKAKGTITTIDGNTGVGNEANGGAVMYRTRSLVYVMDGYRPDYALTKEEKENSTARTMYEIQVPLLQEGDEGEDVKVLQNLLVINKQKVKVDGKFGPDTKKKLIAYQHIKKLTEDGKCGPQVWRSFIGG